MNNIGRNSFDLGYMDSLACGDSPLHSIDPRSKIVATLAFVAIVVSFDRYAISGLMPFFIYPAAMISVGRLPAAYIFKKVLEVSPFAVLVGMFNPIIDRHILFSVGPIGVSGGWASFISIIIKFVLTVTAALVLVASTGINRVCDSLVKMGVPRPFVVQILFFYRYIFVLTDEAERMTRARSFRTFDSKAIGIMMFGPFIGNLLLRTLDRAERIYVAMRCRGFEGQMRMVRSMVMTRADIYFAGIWMALFVFLRHYNVSFMLGQFITGVFR